MTIYLTHEDYLRSIIADYDRHDAMMCARLQHQLAKAEERFDREAEQEIRNELALRAEERQRRLAPVFDELVQLEAMKPPAPIFISKDALGD